MGVGHEDQCRALRAHRVRPTKRKVVASAAPGRGLGWLLHNAGYLWAMLLARVHEALPLSCPTRHSQMRIIAFINDAGTVKTILDHIGESTQPPRIVPARGPPLCEAAAAEQAENDPQWDQAAQPRPEVEFDQRIAW
jgi:hypothetical protein